jgi:hypothetical protein
MSKLDINDNDLEIKVHQLNQKEKVIFFDKKTLTGSLSPYYKEFKHFAENVVGEPGKSSIFKYLNETK